MPKSLGEHEEPSIFGVDGPTVPEAAGEEPVVEDLPNGGPQEHGTGSDSLSVVVTHVDDDGKPAKPSGTVKAPQRASHTTRKPGASKSGD